MFKCIQTKVISRCRNVLVEKNVHYVIIIIRRLVFFRWYFRDRSTVGNSQTRYYSIWKIHGTAEVLLYGLQVKQCFCFDIDNKNNANSKLKYYFRPRGRILILWANWLLHQTIHTSIKRFRKQLQKTSVAVVKCVTTSEKSKSQCIYKSHDFHQGCFPRVQ